MKTNIGKVGSTQQTKDSSHQAATDLIRAARADKGTHSVDDPRAGKWAGIFFGGLVVTMLAAAVAHG